MDAGRSTSNKLGPLNLLKLLQKKKINIENGRDLDEMMALAMKVEEWKLVGKNNFF
jgi:hypothetical protein